MPRDRDDELAPDPAGDRVRLGRVGLVDDDLGDPVAVAQVQEDELAVVAPAMDPAGEARRRSRRRRRAAARGVGAIGRGEAGGRGRHGPRMVFGPVIASETTPAQSRPSQERDAAGTQLTGREAAGDDRILLHRHGRVMK